MPPKQPARIVIRREMRKGMLVPDYRVTCGADTCEYEDKSDEIGAQTIARKHNRDKHGGTLIVKFENADHNRARVRAAAQEDD